MTAPAAQSVTSRRPAAPSVQVVPKHHALVRLSHWLNVPLLLGLIASGLSIYWASPVFLHTPNPATQSSDYLADAGIWIVRHVPAHQGDYWNERGYSRYDGL